MAKRARLRAVWVSPSASSNLVPCIASFLKKKSCIKRRSDRMKRGTTNPLLKELIVALKRKKKAIWKAVAKELEASARRRIAVDLWKIDKKTKVNDTVIVPGKVLGDGELGHKVTVAALGFSSTAKEKLKDNAISIHELIEKNPKGTGVKILK